MAPATSIMQQATTSNPAPTVSQPPTLCSFARHLSKGYGTWGPGPHSTPLLNLSLVTPPPCIGQASRAGHTNADALAKPQASRARCRALQESESGGY